jgi:hypothetical protein
MASTYSQYKIELVGTGEQAGTWGTTTNNNFGSATPGTYQGFEQAIGGRADVTMSGTTTLSLTNSNAAQDARALYLNLSGTLSGAADLVVPALQKSYLVKNGTTGGFAVTIKVIGQTGVSIPNGKTVWVYNNGTDIVTAVDFIPEIATTTVDATNIEVTNIKAKDGTSAGSIADSTGVVTLASSVLTTTDINGGTIDGAVIGGASAAAGSFTTLAASSTLTVTGAGSVQGLTVGQGAGSVSTNTAVGASALAANTTGASNTAVGSGALDANTTGQQNIAVGVNALGANTTGANNTAVGYGAMDGNETGGNNTAVGFRALEANTTGGENNCLGVLALLRNTTGSDNTAMGRSALQENTTGSNNTAVGRDALLNNTTGANNTAVGYNALDANETGEQNTAVGSFAGTNITTAVEVTAVGYAAMSASGTAATGSTAIGRAALNNVTGTLNTAIGHSSGNAITSGSKNTILGSYNGNAGGLDIRTASNYIVLSDGDGNPLVSTADNQTVALEGAVPNSGTGITFPATQSASSNAHTLDDYEEGTWSAATITAVNATGVSFSEGRYTKIGNFVHVQGKFTLTVTTANTLTYVFMVLPFTPLLTTTGSLIDNVSLVAGTAQASSNGSAYAFIAASASNPAGATDWFVSYEYQV